MAGLEAGRFGVPTVAFGVGGIPEWLEDGVNGVLLDPRKLTAGAFAAGIVRAVTLLRGGQRLRIGAREVSSRFKIETHVDSLVSIFENAKARGPSGSRA
jgi:glycosyltransferase involved in cell wall biosynthesis